MGTYTKMVKEYLNLDNIDVREVLDELGVDYRESGKNIGHGWVGTHCPFCNENSYHLGIHLDSTVMSCFVCGQTGNILTYTAKQMRSYKAAIAFLKKFIPIELRPPEEETYNTITKVELPSNATKTPSKYQINYLKKRGYNWKTLHDKYDFYYCGPTGNFANRIIVPVYSQRRIVTFTSIDIVKDTNLRYRHLAEKKSIIPIKNTLFGIENTNKHSVIVVEGLFDKFRIGDNCVCSFGTQVKQEQILLLSKFARVYICFDGDDAGRKAARKLSDNLAAFTEVFVITLANDYDPDSLPRKEIKELQNLIK